MTGSGTFRIDFEIENPAQPGYHRAVRHALVDTAAELSWIPGEVLEEIGVRRRKTWDFRQPDGTVLSRWTGAVSLYVRGVWTVDEVVFGEMSDDVLLGARSLSGLNFRVDPVTMSLVDAGPGTAAALASTA
jgi:predicted aspartyl protease